MRGRLGAAVSAHFKDEFMAADHDVVTAAWTEQSMIRRTTATDCATGVDVDGPAYDWWVDVTGRHLIDRVGRRLTLAWKEG